MSYLNTLRRNAVHIPCKCGKVGQNQSIAAELHRRTLAKLSQPTCRLCGDMAISAMVRSATINRYTIAGTINSSAPSSTLSIHSTPVLT